MKLHAHLSFKMKSGRWCKTTFPGTIEEVMKWIAETTWFLAQDGVTKTNYTLEVVSDEDCGKVDGIR